MTSSPTPSGVPPTPSPVTPGLVVVAGLVVCWLTEDPLVLRTAATVATVAALIAIVQLTRSFSAVNTGLSAEVRTQNREIVRLRDAVNELHEQLGDQKDGVERVRREALRVRDEAAQVREEAAALLEAADSKVGALGGGTLESAFTGSADAFAEPLTGPRQAYAYPVAPPVDDRAGAADLGDDQEPVHAPFAGQTGYLPEPPASDPAPPPPPPSNEGSDEQLGYLEDFSIQGPDDEPLTQQWSADDDGDSDEGEGTFRWGFADAEPGRDSRR